MRTVATSRKKVQKTINIRLEIRETIKSIHLKILPMLPIRNMRQKPPNLRPLDM